MTTPTNDDVITVPEVQTDIAAAQTRFDAAVVPTLRDPAVLTLSREERAMLRRLAAEVAELAARPIEAEKPRLVVSPQRTYRHPSRNLLRSRKRLE